MDAISYRSRKERKSWIPNSFRVDSKWMANNFSFSATSSSKMPTQTHRYSHEKTKTRSFYGFKRIIKANEFKVYVCLCVETENEKENSITYFEMKVLYHLYEPLSQIRLSSKLSQYIFITNLTCVSGLVWSARIEQNDKYISAINFKRKCVDFIHYGNWITQSHLFKRGH